MIDDIITFSKTFEEHLEHIKTVLDRIRKACLTLNAKKCHVATNKIRLFGFEICNGIVTPDDEKIRAVKNWPVPNTRRQLKSFLGFCGYFRTQIKATTVTFQRVLCGRHELALAAIIFHRGIYSRGKYGIPAVAAVIASINFTGEFYSRERNIYFGSVSVRF